MAKYRRKPVQFEVIQFDGANLAEVEAWAKEFADGKVTRDVLVVGPGSQTVTVFLVDPGEGPTMALPSDWIVCVPGTESLWVCNNHDFHEQYDPERKRTETRA